MVLNLTQQNQICINKVKDDASPKNKHLKTKLRFGCRVQRQAVLRHANLTEYWLEMDRCVSVCR